MNRPSVLLITTFGLGRLRPAPGTWGSLPPVVLAGALIALGFGPADHPLVYHACLALVLAVFCGACITQGDAAEARSIKGKDPSEVVADETAGQCLPLMFLPASAVAGWASTAFTLGFAFVSFRVLDILKPWPAHGLQRVRSGWGILLDDLVAGVYAALILQVTSRWTTAIPF